MGLLERISDAAPWGEYRRVKVSVEEVITPKTGNLADKLTEEENKLLQQGCAAELLVVRDREGQQQRVYLIEDKEKLPVTASVISLRVKRNEPHHIKYQLPLEKPHKRYDIIVFTWERAWLLNSAKP